MAIVYRHRPGLRTRPIRGSQGLLAFAPAPATACSLNLTAWLILELCNGSTYENLEEKFTSVAPNILNGETVTSFLNNGLQLLVNHELIEATTE